MKRLLLAVITLSGLCLLNGCSSSESGSSPPPPAPATHFSVVAQANANAGTAFNLTVTAQDASNRQVSTIPGRCTSRAATPWPHCQVTSH